MVYIYFIYYHLDMKGVLAQNRWCVNYNQQ